MFFYKRIQRKTNKKNSITQKTKGKSRGKYIYILFSLNKTGDRTGRIFLVWLKKYAKKVSSFTASVSATSHQTFWWSYSLAYTYMMLTLHFFILSTFFSLSFSFLSFSTFCLCLSPLSLCLSLSFWFLSSSL